MQEQVPANIVSVSNLQGQPRRASVLARSQDAGPRLGIKAANAFGDLISPSPSSPPTNHNPNPLHKHFMREA